MSGRATRVVVAALGVLVLSAGSWMSLASAEPDPARVEGEVMAVGQRVMGEGGEIFDEIVLRTREQSGMKLRLGRAGDLDPPCTVGDRVRVKLMKGGPVEGAFQVRTLWNEDTRQRARIRDRQGQLLRSRSQRRSRDGSCAGEPRRIHSRDHRHDREAHSDSGLGGGRGGASGRGNGR